MPATKNKHQIRHVVDAVYSTPWAVTAAKFADILALLDRREHGLATEEDLAAFSPDRPAQQDESGSGYVVTAGGVGVLSLSGVLSQRMNLLTRFSGGTSTEQFGAAFQKALKDPAVKAIVLDVNSPGGSVGGTAELSDLIFKARGDKPIVAVADTQMASGAYWIGSAANEVVASPSANVGSIGVYMVHSETSKADLQLGRKRSVISAGKYKTVSNDSEPLSAAGRAKLQEYVNAGYDLFVEAVARNRGAQPEAVRSGYGEGDALFARDAVAAGLADRVASFQDVIDEFEARFSGGAATAGVPAVRNTSFPQLAKLKGASMDPKLIAALFAKGLISEATQEAAAAYFTARGEAIPTDVAAYTQKLFAPAAAAAPPAQPASESARAPAAEAPGVDAIADAVVKRLGQQAERDAKFLADQTTAACQLMGLSAEATAAIAAEKKPLDEARELIRRQVAGDNEPLPRLTPSYGAGESEVDRFSKAAEEALTFRCMTAAGFTPEKQPDSTARDLLHVSLLDLGEKALRMAGVRTERMSRGQIARLALAMDQPGLLAGVGGSAYYGTSSFPNLTLNVMRKVLMRGFTEAPVTWRTWARQGESVPDFKQFSIVKFGEASDLEMVPEGHEIPTDTGLSDSREYATIAKFAQDVSLTYEMMTNDDAGALSRLPRMQGVAAARTVNKEVYKILTGNPTMADTGALFNATAVTTAGGHANLLGTGSTTAAPPSVATLNLAQGAMRIQKGLNADAILNLGLRWLIVPAALEGAARNLLFSTADPASNNPESKNIHYGNVLPVVEALLDGSSTASWFTAADNGLIDTIAVYFLQGEETPFTESYWNPKNDSRVFKIRQSFAALAVDFRGVLKHTGYSA